MLQFSGAVRFVAFGLAFLPAILSAATEIHVSLSGDDANPGSVARPVATPRAAQALVRRLIAAGLEEPVEEVIAAGNYHIHNAMQTTIDGACIHFATMNHLNAPNFILNNWLHDIWGYDQKPDGVPVRKLANGIFLDWDTSNTTVKDNWVYNAGGAPVKVIWENWNVVNTGTLSTAGVDGMVIADGVAFVKVAGSVGTGP